MEGKNQLHTTKRGTYRILWTKFVTPLIVHRHSSGCSPTLVGRWAYTMGHFLNKSDKLHQTRSNNYLDLDSTILFWKKTKKSLETSFYYEKVTEKKMNFKKVPI